MAFLETPRFPEKVSAASGWTGGPGYKTDIVTVDSGREQRNQVWQYPRHMFDASHAARPQARWEELRDFFHVAAGMQNGFRVKDWFDYAAINGQGQFLAIDATHFQMIKVYLIASTSRIRVISKPVQGTITVFTGIVASTDYATGIVTMTSGTPTSWSGEFDVPCRFGIDEMNGRVVTPTQNGDDLLIDWDSIPIIEIRI